MDAPIQAKSLASLNELADNPPSELSTKLRRSIKGELTLYIARVPGSRDVFLTTMKPRDKVVTAQDVESSLYYCHLETAEDEAIRASVQSNDSEDKNEPAAAEHGLLHPPLPNRISQLPSPPISPNAKQEFLRIPRKPISSDPEHHTDEYLVPQPLQTRSTPPRSTQPPNASSGAPSPQPAIPRKPVGGHTSNQLPPPFPRRPAGPRPLSKGDDLPIPVHTMDKENQPPYPGSARSTLPLRQHVNGIDIPSPLPARTQRRNTDESPRAATFRQGAPPPLQLHRATDTFGTSSSSARFRPPSSSSSSEDSLITDKDFTVTVIRRDPGTGTQWNIGRLTKDDMLRDSSANKVALEISSGAYDKFGDETEDEDTGTEREDPEFAYRPFRRDLHLRRRRKVHSARPSPGFHASSNPGSPGGAELGSNDAANVPFSFSSPWHGSCDFTTGVGGRTMRCRHSYVPGSVTGAGSLDAKMALVNSSAISELRFNLPVYKKKQKRESKHRPTSSAQASPSAFESHSRLGAGMGHLKHRFTRSFDSSLRGAAAAGDERDDWDDAILDPTHRLDLSLGREHAGGGLVGNKAKLGKLIVEGDGMLMLDLVVMANMGLWWSVASK